MTNTKSAVETIDQETIVRSLTELFADEEGVPLIDYASTLHQLSQRDDDSFRSLPPEETTSDLEGCNPVVASDDNQQQQFSDAQEFWQAFKMLLASDRKLSKSELEALKSEIRFQHQRSTAKKAPKSRRKSSVRRRKVIRAEGEMEGAIDALLSPTTTTRLRVRKISRPKENESSDGTSSRGRSPSSNRERRSSLPRRGSGSTSGLRRNSISGVEQEVPKSPKTPNDRASSRSKGRTRRLSIGKSPRRTYIENNEEEDDFVDDKNEITTDAATEPEKPIYLSTGDVEKIKHVMASRNIKPVLEEKVKGSWLDTPKALISMAMPGGSKPSSPGTKSPGTKSPKAPYKHQHEAVISWIRVAPANGTSILKKSTPRRSSATATTPPTHSRNNSGDVTPHARQLHTIPMGSLFLVQE